MMAGLWLQCVRMSEKKTLGVIRSWQRAVSSPVVVAVPVIYLVTRYSEADLGKHTSEFINPPLVNLRQSIGFWDSFSISTAVYCDSLSHDEMWWVWGFCQYSVDLFLQSSCGNNSLLNLFCWRRSVCVRSVEDSQGWCVSREVLPSGKFSSMGNLGRVRFPGGSHPHTLQRVKYNMCKEKVTRSHLEMLLIWIAKCVVRDMDTH